MDPQVGKSAVDRRTFLTVREFLWYNCSAVCGSSAQQLYGGVNGDLLQENLYHKLFVPGLQWPEALSPRRPLLTVSLPETLKTQRQAWLTLCGVSGSWCTQDFDLAHQASLAGTGFDSKYDFVPPTALLGLLLCSWTWVIFSW